MLTRMNARTRRSERLMWLTLVGCLLLPSRGLAQGPTPQPYGEPFPAPSGSAPARTAADGPKLSAWVYTGAHFAGRQQQGGDLSTSRRDLDPAFTLGARVELSTSPYLALGVFADYLRLGFVVNLPPPASSRREDSGILSLGVWIKGSIPFRVGGQDASLYLGIPVGLGLVLSSSEGGNTFGLLVGAMVGGSVQVTDVVGLFLEAGLRADRYTLEDDRGLHERMSFIQASLRGGVSFAF